MKDKELSLNTIETIEENMNKIKSLNDWESKISLIKETKEMIKKEKIHLSSMKKKLDEDLEDNLEFGKMNLEKVIGKIHKNKSLNDKIEKVRLLKLWLQQQKDKVQSTH